MSKKAMKLALEALEKANRRTVVMGSTGSYREGQIHALESVCTDLAPAITAIREALAEESSGTEQPAQPQQEPVAREHITDGSPCWCEPETNYKDPETGISVIVHKEPQ